LNIASLEKHQENWRARCSKISQLHFLAKMTFPVDLKLSKLSFHFLV